MDNPNITVDNHTYQEIFRGDTQHTVTIPQKDTGIIIITIVSLKSIAILRLIGTALKENIGITIAITIDIFVQSDKSAHRIIISI